MKIKSKTVWEIEKAPKRSQGKKYCLVNGYKLDPLPGDYVLDKPFKGLRVLDLETIMEFFDPADEEAEKLFEKHKKRKYELSGLGESKWS